jgi:hypothetical protein
MSQNAKKKVPSVAAFSLCYPINEEVPQLRRQFVGVGRSKARKGALERKVTRQVTLRQDTCLKRKVSKQWEVFC